METEKSEVVNHGEEESSRTEKKKRESISAVNTIVVTGLLALLGTIVGGVIKGYWDVELAQQKYQSDLVLKALESSSAEERLESLKLLVRTNLIKESAVRDGVDKYIDEKQKDPSTIPQVKAEAAQSLEPPIIENARIYLLSGKKDNTTDFEALRNELTAANFAVQGARSIVDPGRPDQPEIRYFHASDKSQAEKIAEYMRIKFPGSAFPAKLYEDAKAKTGYIEIWLGR